VITEHPADGFIYHLTYMDIQWTADYVFIQITLSEGRSVETKQAFYKAVADGLHERLKIRREDVFINLVDGVAQYDSLNVSALALYCVITAPVGVSVLK
jgi:4-oxalocrotonate tautomerase